MIEIGGQINIFDYLRQAEDEKKPKLLSVGDKIAKVVLGECRIATITKVEGLPDYPFYRTDVGGCYEVKDGKKTVEELMAIAEHERKKYKTIIPKNLSKRITVEYEPREHGGRTLWAQIGIIENMLFWKHDVTYQFLEPYESEKKLMKEYEKHRKRILDEMNGHKKYRFCEEEKPMRRLYWSKHGFYADAEYVQHNG